MASSSNKEYVMGHDHPEINRLRQQHLWLKNSMPKLILAPVDKSQPGQKILDSGTADGIWLNDISSQFSDVNCIGSDIAPHLFPSDPPAHIEFITQSIKEPWAKEMNSRFDLVHQRLVLACCNREDAKVAVARLVELTRPGGWIQLMECDHSGAFSPEVTAKNPGLVQFGKLVMAHLESKGQFAQQGLYLKQYLAEAGIINLVEKTYDMPVGKAADDQAVGEVAARNLTEVAGKMQGDQGFVEQLEEELNTIGGTQRFHVVYGQRPLETT